MCLEQRWQESDGGKEALSWSSAPAVTVNLELALPNDSGLAAEWVTLSHPKSVMGGIRTFLGT